MRLLAPLSVVLAALVFVTSAVAQEQFTLTVSIGSETADVGSQATVQLRLHDIEDDPIPGWIIDVAFDDEIAVPTHCFADSSSLCDLELTRGVLRVQGASASGLTEEMLLAEIRFSCLQEGQTPLALEPGIGTVGMPLVDFTTEDGSVTCREPVEAAATPPVSLPPTGTGSRSQHDALAIAVLFGAGAILLGGGFAASRVFRSKGGGSEQHLRN